MVLVPERERRTVAADILNSHGAEFVGFYGPMGMARIHTGERPHGP
jgi:hypothetical protein